jgi:phenylacetate-CoA ligase
VTFGGRVLVPPEQTEPPFWRANVFSNNTQFSSYHLSAATAPAYYEKIKALQPALIDSYPSSIHVLVRFMRSQGLSGIQPKAIITSSETLLAHQRQTIEETFGCRVFDQYGGAEQVAFVCQCEQGSYHVNPEYGVVELLDEKGEPVPPGEPGELVATGFSNEAMPLIRYRTGDIAIWAEESCGCGRRFPTLRQIEGRRDDLLVTRDGRYIGRLDPIFKGLGHTIGAAQIIQTAYGQVTLCIERDAGYQERDGLRVAEELRKRLGPETQVTIEYPERIERTSGGKFRAVVCRLKEGNSR